MDTSKSYFLRSIYFLDAKAQGEAVKDQKVTSVYRTQIQLQLTIHEQKDRSKNQKNRYKIIIIIWWHNFNQTFKLLRSLECNSWLVN